MIEHHQAQSVDPPPQGRGPPCPTCAAFSLLSASMLDTKAGKLIHLYKCSNCGQRIWDDNRQSAV
jgi:transcription elongation factor Elf1